MTSDTPVQRVPAAPTSLRRLDEAAARHPELTAPYLAGMWVGDPIADAFVAEFATIGHGRGMRMLRTAMREGIDAVPDAPASLVALVAEIERVPEWVDLAGIDAASAHLGRYTRQAGIVLGAASLVSGYANSAASRPLEMTGRYIESAGMRTIEVASWLVESASKGGLTRYGTGLEMTVRVRMIHALVRASLRQDLAAWGVPINQSYLAYTLTEFCLIPLRGMRAVGAPYQPHEVAAYYARWRYLGHLLGIGSDLLPLDAADQEALEEIYLMTRPVAEPYCQRLVASINREFLVPEVEQIVPRPLHPVAPTVVHALERVFLGDEICDELAVPDTRFKHALRVLGPVLSGVNGLLDRVPGSMALRTSWGERYRVSQDARLRERYGVRHDLVDAAPTGAPHPARPAEGGTG